MTSKTVRMSIDISIKDHKRIKFIATMKGISIKEFVTEFLHEKRYQEKVPNKQTQKAIEDLRKKRNLRKAKNINKLFEDLGI